MRFVIHHHVTDPDHYDLMIEKGDVLHTWQILNESFQKFIQGEEVQAEKIQDHRKKYLNYEGPINCDRGMVEIYDSGEYIERKWDQNISISIEGKKLKGDLYIQYCEDYYIIPL